MEAQCGPHCPYCLRASPGRMLLSPARDGAGRRWLRIRGWGFEASLGSQVDLQLLG